MDVVEELHLDVVCIYQRAPEPLHSPVRQLADSGGHRLVVVLARPGGVGELLVRVCIRWLVDVYLERHLRDVEGVGRA